MHVGCQWVGVTLFVAAFIIAFVQFSDPIIGADVGQAHMALGILVMILVVLQMVVAHVARPGPVHKFRKAWNLFHFNLGRVVVLVAWAAVFTGIYIYQEGNTPMLAVWIEPCAIVAGTLVLLDIGLSWRKACNDRDIAQARTGRNSISADESPKPSSPGLPRSGYPEVGVGGSTCSSHLDLHVLQVEVQKQQPRPTLTSVPGPQPMVYGKV